MGASATSPAGVLQFSEFRARGARLHTKTITLESGGTITLSGDFNLFELSLSDREFVDELSDRIHEYGSVYTLPQADEPIKPALDNLPFAVTLDGDK